MTSFTGMEPITPVVQLLLPANGPKDEGKELKSKSLSFLLFGGIASIMLIGGYESSDIGVSVFGGFMLLVVILSAIQYGIQKRVATMMRAASIDGDSSEMTEDTQICAQIPPFRMDVYEQNELSGNGFKLNQSLSETENIFGLTPLRIFYFFNFYSTNSLLNKVSGGFRRHGTVFYLGSPADIAFSKFFQIVWILFLRVLMWNLNLNEFFDFDYRRLVKIESCTLYKFKQRW